MRAPIVIRGRPVDVEWARRELHPHGREPFASIHSLRSGKGNAKKRIRLDLNTIPIQRAERAALVVEEQTREAEHQRFGDGDADRRWPIAREQFEGDTEQQHGVQGEGPLHDDVPSARGVDIPVMLPRVPDVAVQRLPCGLGWVRAEFRSAS
jgi:hypothetical protein